MYLLDINVVSELRRRRPHQAVIQWIRGVPDGDLYLAALTIGELQAGVEITRPQDPAKAAEIEGWIDQVMQTWNILPMDAAVMRSGARLMHGKPDDLHEDALIAAVAIVHRLTVVTRNLRDFMPFGVKTFNPFRTA
ncbi:MAG TPA: type II toxin-antitoxin system VapC family toxin [Acetobacteraceae bacterium]|nr:type II toxin-antitoxin system VapC family toxin [Acetobacteraceae bacterium]